MARKNFFSFGRLAHNKSLARQFLHRLWHWFIEPSRKITRPDKRRQATLLTGVLFGAIILTVVNKVAFGSLNDWSAYQDYLQTILTVLFLSIVYAFSRTQYLQLTAVLAVITGSVTIFMIGSSETKADLRGLLDYIILPLWLGSLYLDFKKIMFLIVGILGGLLVFPFVVPGVTLNDILIGPFAFMLTTSIVLVIITFHRNMLEQDHHAELLAKEQRSRRDADRAGALLRIADRLNARLDMESVLSAISEEVSRALNTPVSIVTLYDQKQDYFYSVAGAGLSSADLLGMPYFPMTGYGEMVKELGTISSLPDIQASPDRFYLSYFKKINLRSIAFAPMRNEHGFIGILCAATLTDQRDFTKDDLLLLKGLADQAALALVNTRLYDDSQRRLEHLQALRTIDIAIISNRDLRENLNVLLERISNQLKIDAAVFLLLDKNRQQLDFAASLGFRTPALRYTRLRLGDGIAGMAALEKRMINIPDLRTDTRSLASAPFLDQEAFISYYAVPLIAQGNVKGVLEIFHRAFLAPDDEWVSFLEALADQAAIAIESTALFTDLQLAHDDLSQAYGSTIEGWSHALDLRDKETEGHTQRVTEMTLSLGRAMGLSEADLIHVRRGALLHDIGKMGVPDQILLKPDKLTGEEWEIMRKHPVYAFELLSPITYLHPALDIPYCHHEKWDGTGYPRGLRGEQIPFAARLFTVIDVWDALSSDRPYRKSWPEEKVVEHIRLEAGTHFDPKVTEAFLNLLHES